MTDFTSLQQKVNALKAKVEHSSITPSILGSILDDFIIHISEALSEVSLILNSVSGLEDKIGICGGIAPLDDSGRVPELNLPQQLLYSNDPALKSKLPQDIIPPAITPDKMDDMDGGIIAKYAGTHSRYRIVRPDNGKIIGILDILYDSTTQVLTQVVITHYDLKENSGFTIGSPLTVGMFYRSRPLSGSSGLLVNSSGWTDWKRLNVSPDSFGSELKKSENFVLTFLPLFSQAVSTGGSYLWSETEYSRKDQPMRANGYYPEVNPDEPFYVCGCWLDVKGAAKVLLDRYTPYMGGVQCSTPVNLPLLVKSTDSSLSLDYACVNNANSLAIVLGSKSWTDSVRPVSMKRAFHGCSNLRAVIGEIDMSSIKTAWEANNLFVNCPKLWQFHLANIPDAIETLDLSGCSDNITAPFVFDSGQPAISSLKYLCNNFKRDIIRSKILTVRVSENVYDEISNDPFYTNSGITWTVL
ncbi:MAG: hypothetical protein K2M56_01005 [Muribaculaceae bacterium]|nr:hypothetical protein [Muribaculaceae bacterium]